MINFNPEGIYFGWYEGPGKNHSSRPYTPTKGPHHELKDDDMLHWVVESRRDYIHSIEELLKFGWSKSKQERIKSARIGTIIQVSTIHNCANLYIKRISAQEINELNAYNEQIEELALVNAEILAKTKQLQEKKSELEKSIKGLPYGKKYND